ncbi:unnamed protein product [Periconia digitata]|uniref:MYND-type domain-containing protein n=1 Tax=Periconia digitata TaxID=1303443 RepID=A0A9W4UC61_9PLEO|nr:unnamed protein product [Periconia digitata]
MPPRSVCLNVFTTSLSNAIPKESNVWVREVDSDVDMKEDATVTERARHDSLQSSPNETMNAAPYSVAESTTTQSSSMPFTNIQTSLTPDGITTLKKQHAVLSSVANPQALVCGTCGQAPAPGASLQRCSRCKAAFYCSKVCQKVAWKVHRTDCGSASAIATPNISVPGSPTDMQGSSPTVNTSSPPRRLPQSTSEWVQSSGNQGKLHLSSGDNVQYENLRDLLVCGYWVYASENGGVALTRDDMLEEFKCYVDAVGERVKTGGMLDGNTYKDQMYADLVNSLQDGSSPLLKNVTPAEVLGHYGDDVLQDIDQIRTVVYGA